MAVSNRRSPPNNTRFNSNEYNKKAHLRFSFFEASVGEGGLDGTRTRDLLRDRQAF